MSHYSISIIISLFLSAGLLAETNSLGFFTNHSDIGNPKLAGSVDYDPATGKYIITGAGENIWAETDEFHYVYRKIEGDFIVRARMKLLGEGSHAHRKMGIMVRKDLTHNSPHATTGLHGDGLTSLQYRKEKGGITEEVKSPSEGPDVVQLERRGNTFIMSTANAGETFKTVQLDSLDLGNSVYVGLYICSHKADVKEKAVAKNVRIVKPAPEGFTPYQDYIGSRIEVMDLETETRKIVHTSEKSLQAPNWTTDGEKLVYNSQGKMYTFDIDNKTIEELNTGFATSNNNDHVLSFDGKMLGISHHSAKDNGNSIIYILPSKGGEPKRITPKGPSYLHGWSPDGEKLIYTGERDGKFDIYKIDIDTQEEVRLTDAPGLDDGSEYTPDGEYIYFNSVRTGTMQVWRMRPDGSEQEQITFDKYNDWFPHISPDGKSLVFLSFREDIDPGDHPFYKHVYIRKMPIAGGKPKVIAYLYGGQGTINVPSWSPDSKKIAFISNSRMIE